MRTDSTNSADPRVAPRQFLAGLRLPRWGVTLMALVVLVISAWWAYQWLVDDMAHRRAIAEHTIEPPSEAAPETVEAMPPHTSGAGDPFAPAVIGGNVNRCLLNGQLVYTNTPCPEGSRPAVVSPSGIEPGGVLGVSGEGALAVASGIDDASQRADICNFLAAEISRLDYEFRQPLPPTVLDDISTRLARLRAQADAARCNPPAKPAASTPAGGRVP
ncbi:MAG: hypothetical protein LBE78_03140 [Burkholderiaceae bacterium]|jgi:hypothetical protein|nr:hypothetical protein [Burkholderiaceae bacterium]